MGQSPTRSKKKVAERPTIAAERLRPLAGDWLRQGRMAGFSPRTLRDRELCMERFFWFIERENFVFVGQQEIEACLLHVRTGHEEPEGRFASRKTNPRAFQPVRPNT